MNTSTTVDNTATADKWTNVVDVVLQVHPYEGNYELIVYRHDETIAGTYEIRAVITRAAMLEATAWIKSLGWDPTGAWDESRPDDESLTLLRRFRKAPAT